MDKFKDATLKTEHTSNLVENHKEKFEAFFLAEMEKLKNKHLTFVDANGKLKTFKLNVEILKEEEEKVLKEVTKVFVMAYSFLVATNKELIDVYLKGNTPTSVKGSLKDIRSSLRSAIIVVKNDDYNDLNHLEDKIEAALLQIEDFLPKKAALLVDLDDAKDDFDLAFKIWELQYRKLKLYFKGFFLESGINYKDYFLDLGKPKKRSKKSKEEEEVEEKNENKNLEVEDVVEKVEVDTPEE